jgi:hypothetical protein
MNGQTHQQLHPGRLDRLMRLSFWVTAPTEIEEDPENL